MNCGCERGAGVGWGLLALARNSFWVPGSGGGERSCPACAGVLLCLALSLLFGPLGSGAGVFLVLPHLHMYLQFSALDALAGMMMKGAAKCDKHAE